MTWQSLGFKLTPELTYLIESMKVEGYWSYKHGAAALQNKDYSYIRKLETILKDLQINTYKRILLKIKTKELDREITIKDKNLTNHVEHSPFDGSSKIVFKIPFKSCTINVRLRNKDYIIKVKISDKGADIISNLKIFHYVELAFHKKVFLQFLDEFTKFKRKSHDIRLEDEIANGPEAVTMAAFSALIDAEGSIDHYGLKRCMRIRMTNKEYLKLWQSTLERIGVKSHLGLSGNLHCLTISGWRNFDKLKQMGLKLFHSVKRVKFDKILGSYIKKQEIRNTAMQFYLEKVREFGPISALDLANKLGKKKRSVNHQLKRLKAQRQVIADPEEGNQHTLPLYSMS